MKSPPCAFHIPVDANMLDVLTLMILCRPNIKYYSSGYLYVVANILSYNFNWR